MNAQYQYDFFISHASEDKDDFARALADSLRRQNYRVWYDEFSLKIGDSLRASIDEGLRSSAFGIVLLSPAFFSKKWTQRELGALVSSDAGILPVWHNVTAADVAGFSPILADLFAVSSAEGVERVTERLILAARGGPGVNQQSPAPTPDTGVNFTSRFGTIANALAYATIVAGAAPESPDDLSENALDSFEDWARSLEPAATAHHATPTSAWWHVPSVEPAIDQWQAWLLPGPVVSVIMGMPESQEEGAPVLSFPLLAGWWARTLHGIPALLAKLGAEHAGLGFNLNVYPVGRPGIEDLIFEDAPASYKGGERTTVPPWSFRSPVQRIDDIGEQTLIQGAESLLRHFSDRKLQPVIDWLARGIAEGTLAARSPSATSMAEGTRAQAEAQQSLEKRRELAQYLLRISGHEEDAKRI
jgi:TIR domain